MDVQSVLIELDHGNTLRTTCGTLINNDIIITTSSILTECLQPDELQHNKENLCRLHKTYTFTIIAEHYKNTGTLTNSDSKLYRQAKLAAVFKSKPIKTSIEKYLINWKTSEETCVLKSRMSTFLILTFKEQSIDVLREKLCGLYEKLLNITWGLADRVCIRSTPFGNRHFLNTYSEGVVANVVGGDGALFWSDCPTVFGSEGSPVFTLKGKDQHLIGLLLSSLNWINGEWLGLTLCSSFESILHSFSFKTGIPKRILQSASYVDNLIFNNLDLVKNSIAIVKNGPNWGSAILLDKSKGIFITNAHVIENSHNFDLLWKGTRFNAEIMFEALSDNNYDIAILKVNSNTLQFLEMEVLKIYKGNINIGDRVFAVGYSLYPPELEPNITITSGHVSKITKTMLMTTCSILSGSSGGAILTPNAELIGIITSNTVLSTNKAGFPRINMSIPMYAVWNVLQQFLKNNDPNILSKLTIPDDSTNTWITLKHKL